MRQQIFFVQYMDQSHLILFYSLLLPYTNITKIGSPSLFLLWKEKLINDVISSSCHTRNGDGIIWIWSLLSFVLEEMNSTLLDA